MYIRPISRPKKVAALGALEQLLRAAAVGQRAVEQARAVGAQQVLLDQAQLRARACSGVNMPSRTAWIIGSRL